MAGWRSRSAATSASPRRRARFNVAFIKVGLSACDIGTSWILPRLVGASRAYELMLTGRFADAAEAERIGLVTEVVPDDALLDAALAKAAVILGNGPFGVRMTKEVMWSQLEIGSMQAGIDLENRTQLLSSFSGDMQEAMAAFLEKRPPRFDAERGEVMGSDRGERRSSPAAVGASVGEVALGLARGRCRRRDQLPQATRTRRSRP